MPTRRSTMLDGCLRNELASQSPAGRCTLQRNYFAWSAFLALILAAAPCIAQQLQPGIWVGQNLANLPLPVVGYQVYMMGEMHGAKENVDHFRQYLELLAASSGLRDVALEEDAVYERAAQAYVDGKDSALLDALCLRADLLDVIRRFNQGRPENEHIRVHLTDIDTPADAICRHLLAIQQEVPGAARIRVPAVSGIKKQGLKTVEELWRLLPPGTLLLADPKQSRIRLPSQDMAAFFADRFLLFPLATPMNNRCTPQ